MVDIVALPAMEELEDCMGRRWTIGDPPVQQNLRSVLLLTVRRCPVKTGGEAERCYNLIQAIRQEEGGPIRLVTSDFDWLVAHAKEFGHTVWSAPDAYLLVKILTENVVAAE